MWIPRISLRFAALALTTLLFTAPACSHADTYSIVASWAESAWGFQGMDPSGNVYLDNFYSTNYETQILSPTGSSTITYSNSPLTFTQDRGSICQQSLAGFARPLTGVCNGSLFAFLYAAAGGPDTSLYKSSGAGTAQLITSANNGDLLGMNSLGDIVFDNGFFDQAYYAVDLSTIPAPEPSSLILFTTGILALGAITFHKRRLA